MFPRKKSKIGELCSRVAQTAGILRIENLGNDKYKKLLNYKNRSGGKF